MRFISALLSIGVLPMAALAHHSPNVHFDRNDVVEIDGVLTEVGWQNPHVQLTVVAPDENGREVEWLVEESATLLQERRGVTRDHYQIGEPIRVAGFRGRRNPNALFATNTLLANGQELVSVASAGPRWSNDLVLPSSQGRPAVEAPVNASGLFRVWNRDLTRSGRPLWEERYPLTEQARVAQASWDPVTDNTYLECKHGMPAIMDTPHPMEILRDGNDILIHLEEQDVVRRIHMDANAVGGDPSPFGHSVGRWDGEALVVTTTDIDWPWFDQLGIPQSEDMRLEERFWEDEDERFLNYTVTVTDPAILTEPVVLDRRWFYTPGIEVGRYDCVWERADL